MANDSSNETHRFSTYLTVPTDCKRHEFARQAVQRNKVRPCGRVSLLLFRALKVVVNCQNVCAMASEWRLVGEVEHNLDVVVESVVDDHVWSMFTHPNLFFAISKRGHATKNYKHI